MFALCIFCYASKSLWKKELETRIKAMNTRSRKQFFTNAAVVVDHRKEDKPRASSFPSPNKTEYENVIAIPRCNTDDGWLMFAILDYSEYCPLVCVFITYTITYLFCSS